jgi:sugar/nucleoside kinase (ribokinase family)
MSMALPDDPLRFVMAGCLNRDTILPLSGPPQIDVFGGNLAYAAVGLKMWGGKAGLLARVGQDYPLEWLDGFRAHGFDLTGIKVLHSDLEARRFMAHEDLGTTHTQNPIQHFAERGLTYPKSLLGYRSPVPFPGSKTTPLKTSIQISDIPAPYLDASAVHICPIDFLSHIVLPSVFRQRQASTITLASYSGYMDPAFWEDLPSLLSDITAFITPEAEIRNLFLGRHTDLWEMAKILADIGPEYVMIQTEAAGYYLLDREAGKRWVIPQYQSKAVDPTGLQDAFAGGFLVGYREHYDPVEAALMGSIAASVVVEGSGVYYGLDVMPGLINARRSALRELIRQL